MTIKENTIQSFDHKGHVLHTRLCSLLGTYKDALAPSPFHQAATHVVNH